MKITEKDINKNYLLSKINGADIMLLGNDNKIDDFAFLENNTGGVILGGNPYVSTYLDTHIKVLCGMHKEIIKTDSYVIQELTSTGQFFFNDVKTNHYIYLHNELDEL